MLTTWTALITTSIMPAYDLLKGLCSLLNSRKVLTPQPLPVHFLSTAEVDSVLRVLLPLVIPCSVVLKLLFSVDFVLTPLTSVIHDA